MTCRKILTLVVLLVVCFAECTFADVQVWQNPSVDFKNLKKIFVIPAEYDLKAGTQLMPPKQLGNDLHAWTVDGINSAVRKGKILIKTLDSVLEDMRFIKGSNIQPGSSEFYNMAGEMGYTAFIRTEIRQKFEVEHVPETTRTYTVYRDIEKRDAKGRLIETLRIPEEKTEIVPAHDVTYLHTECDPKIYSVKDPDGDYIGAVHYDIRREYQGGPVMKVVENVTKAAMKTLFAGKK
ncbi:MAG: hypothetical protein IJP89_11065 [Synergistaceae bacterium]|nr:hypothetical protein [Synergistaceae bacterium]